MLFYVLIIYSINNKSTDSVSANLNPNLGLCMCETEEGVYMRVHMYMYVSMLRVFEHVVQHNCLCFVVDVCNI